MNVSGAESDLCAAAGIAALVGAGSAGLVPGCEASGPTDVPPQASVANMNPRAKCPNRIAVTVSPRSSRNLCFGGTGETHVAPNLRASTRQARETNTARSWPRPCCTRPYEAYWNECPFIRCAWLGHGSSHRMLGLRLCYGDRNHEPAFGVRRTRVMGRRILGLTGVLVRRLLLDDYRRHLVPVRVLRSRLRADRRHLGAASSHRHSSPGAIHSLPCSSKRASSGYSSHSKDAAHPSGDSTAETNAPPPRSTRQAIVRDTAGLACGAPSGAVCKFTLTLETAGGPPGIGLSFVIPIH